jgi:hypothetical protein
VFLICKPAALPQIVSVSTQSDAPAPAQGPAMVGLQTSSQPEVKEDGQETPVTVAVAEQLPAVDENGNALPAKPVDDVPPPRAELVATNLVTTKNESDSDKPVTCAVSEHLNFVARADVDITYDDNIFIQHDHRKSDVIFTLSPTIAFGLGDVRPEFKRLTLDMFAPAVVDETYEPRSFLFFRYTPTLRLFARHDSEDALDHDVALEGRWQLTYLTLGFRTRFQRLTTPDIDVGGRVRRSIFSQEFSATYDCTDKTSLEFGLAGNARHYSTHIDSNEVTAQNWLNYRIGAWTDAALGVTVGYLDVEHGTEQVYEQVLARARYHATEKIELSANAGIEFRQSDGSDRATPVFAISAHYTPFDQTLLALEGSRRTENSATSPGINIEYTGFTFTARQRFAQHYYLGLSASYQAAHYYDFSKSDVQRDDDIFSIRPYVRMELSRSAALEVGYSFYRDSSRVSRFSFEQNQAFLHLDVLF